MSDELKKIFEQAAQDSIGKPAGDSLLIKQSDENELSHREEQIAKAVEIVESGKTKWEELRDKMNGDYAQRFMEEMDTLSGREFVRTYLKTMEYFKPKVIRVQNDTDDDEEDKVLRIEIHHSQTITEEDNTIDITHKEE